MIGQINKKRLLKQMQDLIDVQGSKGNWDTGDYMCGMLNGMLLMRSLVDKKEPDFRSLPEGFDRGNISDGYHTFKELYTHRSILFSVICNAAGSRAWKSKLHADGTMYNGMFVVGVDTPAGTFSYHDELEMWDNYNVQELNNAPEWDGHTSDDILRLYSLLGE